MPDRTFSQWVARGMPSRGAGKRQRFPWPEIYRWVLDEARRQGRDSARPKTFEEAKNRLMAADAEMRELELAQKRGELLTIAAYQQGAEELYQRVRARLDAMPAHLAAILSHSMTIPERQTLIQTALNEVYEELYQAEDLGPLEADAEADGSAA